MPVQDDEQRVDLPQRPEQGRARAGYVLHADRRRRHFLGGDDPSERVEPLVSDVRHADVRLSVLAPARLGECSEERRLARAGQADDADFERHAIRLERRTHL